MENPWRTWVKFQLSREGGAGLEFMYCMKREIYDVVHMIEA